MMTTALFLFAAVPAYARGWEAYYDCGEGVVAVFAGWHGKTWLGGVEENHKLILEGNDVFQDLGMDVREGEEPIPQR